MTTKDNEYLTYDRICEFLLYSLVNGYPFYFIGVGLVFNPVFLSNP